MTAPRLVESTPVVRNGHDDDEPDQHTTLERELAKAAMTRSHSEETRYASIADMLIRLEEKADASLTDIRAVKGTHATLANAVATLSSSVNRLSVRLDHSEEMHGRIVAALSRLEGRGSLHEIADEQQDEQIAKAKAAADAAVAKAERAALAARVRLGTVVTVIVLTLLALGTAGPERVAPLLNFLHSVLH